MENPVQELIVGNIPGASGVESCYGNEMLKQNEMIEDERREEDIEVPQIELVSEEVVTVSETEEMKTDIEGSEVKQTAVTVEENQCAAV